MKIMYFFIFLDIYIYKTLLKMKKYIIYILLLAGSCVCINHINNITLQQIEKLEEIQNTITETELQREILVCLNDNLKTGELCTTKK